MAKHIYIAKQAKGLRLRFIDENDKDVFVQFENGQYSTDDDKIAELIDTHLSTKGSRNFHKADRAAALAMAAQHQAMLKRTGAMKGGVTAGAMKLASEAEKQSRDAELNAIDPSLKDKFDQDENLVLTDEGTTAPSPGLTKGDDPTSGLPTGDTAGQEAEPVDEGELPTEVVEQPKSGLKIGK